MNEPEKPYEYKYPDYDMESMLQEWDTSRQNRENNTNDFVSLDNLVDGVPLNHQNNAPYVGDTTLAGLVRAIPRSSLEQLPVFSASVNGTKRSIKAAVASYILRRGVFNQDTFGKGLLSTMQMGAEQALTHGYAPFMTATGKMFNDFGTTMRLLHYADVDPEPGISDANESGFYYVSANLTKTRVRKIRDAAKENPNTSWDVAKLDELLEMDPKTKFYSIYLSDPQKKAQAEYTANTYQFVTKYEVGNPSEFVTFCPQLKECPLRVIKNRSKFGYPRVNFLVIDPAPLTPFGLSRVRLASPNQNLANIYYQNIASMLLLNSKPPILKRGRFTKPVQLKQGVVWEALDQNATAELKSMDNGALAQFKPMMEHLSLQIQNIMGNSIGSINSGSAFSKTAPGVKQQDRVQDISTSQITNILENFLRQYALVALDTYVSERTIDDWNVETNKNETTLIIDDEAKNTINRIAEQEFEPQVDESDPTGQTMTQFVPPVGKDNKLVVDWNEYYDSIKDWTVEIELSMSKDELEEKKRGDLQDTLAVLAQNSEVLGPEGIQKVREITDMLLEKSVPESKRLAAPVAPYSPVPSQPPAPQSTIAS